MFVGLLALRLARLSALQFNQFTQASRAEQNEPSRFATGEIPLTSNKGLLNSKRYVKLADGATAPLLPPRPAGRPARRRPSSPPSPTPPAVDVDALADAARAAGSGGEG